MGNCCCFPQEEKEPLLGSGHQHIGARTGSLANPSSTPAPSYVTDSPQSARQFRPVDQGRFETSIELISKIKLESIPLAAIHKTFQDSARLYNEVVENFRSLEEHIHKFKDHFAAETQGIPILATCVRLLKQKCGDAKLVIERKSKHFIDLQYEAGDIRRHVQGDPETILDQLEHFQTACREIRNILEHAPQLERSVSIVLNTEADLRKEIVKSDLPALKSQAALKAFIDNVSKLRSIAAGTDTIKRDAEKKFKEFSKASQGFFNETSDGDAEQ